jgi:hypothetical protein
MCDFTLSREKKGYEFILNNSFYYTFNCALECITTPVGVANVVG